MRRRRRAASTFSVFWRRKKNAAELDSEVKRGKRELSDYEARNRELSAQVEAVRQQAAQIQEEAQAMKEASLLEKRAQEGHETPDDHSESQKAAPKKDFAAAVDEALKTDVPADMSLEQAKDSAKDVLGRAAAELESAGTVAASTTGTTHGSSGETLYRIGQKYHVGWTNSGSGTT